MSDKQIKEAAKARWWESRRKKATQDVKDAGGVGSSKSTQSDKKFSDKKSGKAFPWSK